MRKGKGCKGLAFLFNYYFDGGKDKRDILSKKGLLSNLKEGVLFNKNE